MDVLRGALTEVDPALEVALAHALLRRVGRGESGPVLRVYRPTSPVLAFGRRDVRLPGFGEAVRLARDEGFAPVVRAPGGRAVGYTRQALVVDHVAPDPDWPSDLESRFAAYGGLWAGVLRDLGVDARVGEVPGEYCPGSHSVNARGEVKLVGTAQRMVRGAWLFSAVLVADDAPVLRALLGRVYGALDLPFAESSVGSLAEELRADELRAGGLSAGEPSAGEPSAAAGLLDRAEQAVLAAYDRETGLDQRSLPQGLLDEARSLRDGHLAPEPDKSDKII